MPVAVRQAVSSNNGGGYAVTFSSCLAGSLLLWIGTSSCPDPAMTLHGSYTMGTTTYVVYKRICTGGETQLVVNYNTYPDSVVMELTGTHPTAPIDAVAVNYPGSNASAPVSPSVTLSGGGALLAVLGDVVNTYHGAQPFATPAGMADVYDMHGWNTHASHFLQNLSSGATGTRTGAPADSMTTSTYFGVGIAIRSANTAPSAPVVTAPNGGEVIDASKTITWTAGTDPEGDTLVYDIDYSANNGGAWTAVASGVSGTSYIWNTSALSAGSSYLVRVRSRDPGGLTSGYDQSNAVFTIQHNVAPNAPTSLAPAGGATVDRTAVQRLSWAFSDPNAGDSQSKYDLQWRLGAGAWTTVTTVTTSQFWDAPANTFPAGSIEWQVRTYDALGVVGPWSASAFLTAATPPAAPAITSPTNGSVVGTPTGSIVWSAPSQTSYQVRKVADLAGSPDTTNVYYDSADVVSSTARDAPLTYPTNGRYEHLQVRVKLGGLWSTWSSVRVQIAYTAPATPTLAVQADSPVAPTGLQVAVTNPTPTGSQPVVASSDLYRRLAGGGGSGIRIAKGLAANAVYTDRSVASGVAYEYSAVVTGTTGTQAQSAWT